MLEVLFASRGVKTPRPVEGAVISFAAHTVIVMALVVSAHKSARDQLEFQRRLLEEPRSKPQFLVPPNRGAPPMQQIHYVAVGGGDADDGIASSKRKFDKRGDFGLTQVRGDELPPEMPAIQLPPSTLPDNAYSVLDVDSAAVRDPSSAAPAYPTLMRMKGIEGFATMRFVIDSTGLIDMATVTLMNASHAEFVQAVREAMPRMRFRPAMMGPQAVRQLSELPFKFEIKNLELSSEGNSSKKPRLP